MLRRALPPDAGLLIEPCRSIHMMFMRFSIDAVFIDSERRVTSVASNVHPWTGFAMGASGTRSVVELPAGAARDIHAGDRLEVVEVSE
jgi:uncharacterized membrane protein (UPF0127 family)